MILCRRGKAEGRLGSLFPTNREPLPGVRRRRRETAPATVCGGRASGALSSAAPPPDVALGDELASSALNLAKANPRLRPLRGPGKRNFAGLTGGLFQAQHTKEEKKSVRRPRCLTNRGITGGLSLPGNRPRFVGDLRGGGCRDEGGDRSLASLQNEATRRDLVRGTICRSECQSRSRANSKALT